MSERSLSKQKILRVTEDGWSSGFSRFKFRCSGLFRTVNYRLKAETGTDSRMSRSEVKLKSIAAAATSIRRNGNYAAKPKLAAVPDYYKLSEITKGLEAVFEVASHINSSLDHNTIIQSGLD